MKDFEKFDLNGNSETRTSDGTNPDFWNEQIQPATPSNLPGEAVKLLQEYVDLENENDFIYTESDDKDRETQWAYYQKVKAFLEGKSQSKQKS